MFVSFLIGAGSLACQTVPEDQVPKDEHSPRVLFERLLMKCATRQKFELPRLSIGQLQPKKGAGFIDIRFSLQLTQKLQPTKAAALPATVLIALARELDSSKTWRIREIDLEHAGADMWTVQSLVVGSRRIEEDGKRAYVSLPCSEAVLGEATGKLAEREDRQVVSIALDLAAEQPTLVAGYRMRSSQPQNELIALLAELKTLTKDSKSPFQSVRALDLEAQEQDAKHVGTVRYVELQVRQAARTEESAPPDAKPKR